MRFRTSLEHISAQVSQKGVVWLGEAGRHQIQRERAVAAAIGCEFVIESGEAQEVWAGEGGLSEAEDGDVEDRLLRVAGLYCFEVSGGAVADESVARDTQSWLRVLRNR